MSNKLTIQQAFEHIKALYPNTNLISTDGQNWTAWDVNFFTLLGSGSAENIDWPKGVTEWSMPSHPAWDIPLLPDDCARKCECSDDGVNWNEGILHGYIHYDVSEKFHWLVGRTHYAHCRIDRNRYPLLPRKVYQSS